MDWMELQPVRENVAEAETADLIYRITFYRNEFRDEAVAIILQELQNRGVHAQTIAQTAAELGDVLRRKDGSVQPCSFCHAPAIHPGKSWFKIARCIPVFPRKIFVCHQHLQSKQK